RPARGPERRLRVSGAAPRADAGLAVVDYRTRPLPIQAANRVLPDRVLDGVVLAPVPRWRQEPADQRHLRVRGRPRPVDHDLAQRSGGTCRLVRPALALRACLHGASSIRPPLGRVGSRPALLPAAALHPGHRPGPLGVRKRRRHVGIHAPEVRIHSRFLLFPERPVWPHEDHFWFEAGQGDHLADGLGFGPHLHGVRRRPVATYRDSDGDPVVQVPAPAEATGLRLGLTRKPVVLPRPVVRGRQTPVPAPTADVDVIHVLLLGCGVRLASCTSHIALGSLGVKTLRGGGRGPPPTDTTPRGPRGRAACRRRLDLRPGTTGSTRTTPRRDGRPARPTRCLLAPSTPAPARRRGCAASSPSPYYLLLEGLGPRRPRRAGPHYRGGEPPRPSV